MLKAGTGTVGSASTPLNVNVGGQVSVYTPPEAFPSRYPTTKLAISSNTAGTSTYGQSVTFTATVSDTGTDRRADRQRRVL